jgi:hypothetical protein
VTTWNPIDYPTDRCLIGGYPTPGLCEVQGASSPRKWDEQAGYAMSGAILIFRGRALSRFTLTFRLFTVEHWQQWADIRPILTSPPSTKKPTGPEGSAVLLGAGGPIEGGGVGFTVSKALDIDHPVLSEVGITHIVIEDTTAPEQTEDGVWTISVKCIEWRRISRGVSKPDGAQKEPTDPLQVELEGLNSEAQRKKAALDGGNP